MIRISIKSSLIAAAAAFSMLSCSNETENPEMKPDAYTVPSTYEFSRNGQSSVDLSLGNQGYLDLNDLNNIAKTFSPSVNGTELKSIYNNKIKNLTATSKDYFGGGNAESIQFQDFFSTQIENQIIAGQNNNTAAAEGIAGTYMDGTKKRLVDGKGIEVDQVIQKGLMGAFLLDRILNEHLGDKVMKNNDLISKNNQKILLAGKNYTELEYHWDTAYGYLGLNKPNNINSFWANYLSAQLTNTPLVNGMREKLDEAFRKGRAALTARDYNTVNEQIKIIRNGLNLVCSTRAVFYLNKRPAAGSNITSGFHAWSEGLGFIYALRFSKNENGQAIWTKAEVDALAAELIGNKGFWDESRLFNDSDTAPGSLKTIAKKIANKYGFNYSDIH